MSPADCSVVFAVSLLALCLSSLSCLPTALVVVNVVVVDSSQAALLLN